MFKLIRLTHKTVLSLLALNFALVACGPSAGSTPTPAASHGNPIGGYVELVDALRAAGATVDANGSVEQEFFSGEGFALKVNGADVQVYEYAADAAREAESKQITPDGQPNNQTMVTWLDRPNFWATGRVIVLYLGTDEALINLLTQVLGAPITQA